MSEKKILFNYILYILTFIVICLVGITGVFAYTYEDVGYVTDKTNVQVEVNYTAQPLPVAQNQHVQLQEVYSIDIFVTNIEFSPDYTYQFELYTPNFILTGANSATVVDQTSSTDNNCRILSTQFTNDYPQLTFKCDSSTNIRALYIRYYNSSNGYLFEGSKNWYWNYAFFRRRVNDTDDNTGEITDSIQNNSQNIMNNQDKNTQDIMNNQDKNAQDIQDTVKENFNDCHQSYNLFEPRLKINNSYITKKDSTVTINDDEFIFTATGTDLYFGEIRSTGGSYSDDRGNLIPIENHNKIYYYLTNNLFIANYFTFYDENKTSIGFYNAYYSNSSINVPNNAKYFTFRFGNNKAISGNTYKTKVMISYEPINEFEKYGQEICINKLDEQTNAINGVTGALTDDDIDDSSATSFFDNFTDNTHGLSGIISAPLVAINSMLNNQCTPLSMIWKGKTISFECGYSFWSRLTGFKEFLNVAIDGLLCYRILLKLFKLIEKFKNPNDDRVEVMDL